MQTISKRKDAYLFLRGKRYFDFQFDNITLFNFGDIKVKHENYENLSISTYKEGSGENSQTYFKIIFEISLKRCRQDFEVRLNDTIPERTLVEVDGNVVSISSSFWYHIKSFREGVELVENLIDTILE
jgi:hypothetical protein